MKFKNIKLLALDIDGVLTDGSKVYSETGKCLSKKFNDVDFTAIKLFKACGIEVVFITGDPWNKWLESKRSTKVYVTRGDDGFLLSKGQVLEKIIFEKKITKFQVWFAGDDIFDLDAILLSGISSCPSNSNPFIKSQVNCLLKGRSGENLINEMFSIYALNMGIKINEKLIKDVVDIDSREGASKC